jgi:hypothetical protein
MPRAAARILLVLLVAACRADDANDSAVRGRGLTSAHLPVEDRVHVYVAALGASFELADPALTLLLDRRVLPRSGGFGGTERLSAALEAALRRDGIVKGICEPPVTSSRKTPHCSGRGPGYVVRFSDVLRRAPDSVEVYLAVQNYDTPNSGASQSMRFERAYQVVRRGESWSAAREARVRETTPGSPASPR